MALVGSYSLNSIIGMKMPQIEPMRILIKSFGDSAITLNSEGSAPPFSELPPIPRNLKPYPFSGAVGSFSLLVSQTQIPFRQNQPFLIRAELQGDGNFAEINVLPFALTSELSLISQNNTSGAFMGTPKRKLFEWVLSTQEPSLQDWTPNPFLTFNPNSRSYQVLTFPTFHFVALPETALPQNILRLSSIPFFPVETWKTRRDWTSTLWFWIVQLLFFFLVLGRVLVLQLQLFHTRRLQDPFFHRKLKINRANQALKNQNWEEFLSIASRMSRELIASGKGTSFHPSLSLFIEADNQLRFSPSKTLSVSRDTLKLEWESLSKALKSPHPTDDK
ncbi:hypothetical protein EBT16_05930 [bacterium]|nr:hypothetical protein [bacterium]